MTPQPTYHDHIPLPGAVIDWSQQQPYGVWRCSRGWQGSAGNDFGCQNRATVDLDDGSHVCIDCAHVIELTRLRQATEQQTDAYDWWSDDIVSTLDSVAQSLSNMEQIAEELNTALATIAWNSHPPLLRFWYWLRSHWQVWVESRRCRGRLTLPSGRIIDTTPDDEFALMPPDQHMDKCACGLCEDTINI